MTPTTNLFKLCIFISIFAQIDVGCLRLWVKETICKPHLQCVGRNLIKSSFTEPRSIGIQTKLIIAMTAVESINLHHLLQVYKFSS